MVMMGSRVSTHHAGCRYFARERVAGGRKKQVYRYWCAVTGEEVTQAYAPCGVRSDDERIAKVADRYGRV